MFLEGQWCWALRGLQNRRLRLNNEEEVRFPLPLPQTAGAKRYMASFFTIGVAGHAGHGKTSLTSLLTGVETQRIPEEKRRGLTIESKVAPLPLASGKTLTLIDVPGTPKFLTNVIRGAGRFFDPGSFRRYPPPTAPWRGSPYPKCRHSQKNT